MPSKTEEYLALAQRTANGLTRYWESWTDYLTTASRLYKYPFADQLMIYAQRPDATACAEFDIWRNRIQDANFLTGKQNREHVFTIPGITNSSDQRAMYRPCRNFMQKPSHRRSFCENKSEKAASFPSARFRLKRAYPSRTAPPTISVKMAHRPMLTSRTASRRPPLG